ncbi:23S rRNA (adenine(2503)-C(2))-methyltransferase RlmN [Vulgatibacter incomptus]|uniref:Ribosomal RNA large subunit methyltransferase N n=1 Tax=Vulgatibacter incomptus TaxID=1391653 RepID=A0A0K1PJ78_9BACT|nr:23S rRNA (adenine(2503)-C(2))-methyltransferase RlmN [Vulgatibacter incomptus]AKU93159.1 Ribosomal RNA large subunit methyltransferase N [Vulgatibacter incomptus]
MHVGSLTSDQLAEWARTKGASEASARQLARAVMGRFTNREVSALPSKRLLEEAERELGWSLPESTPVEDPDGTIRHAVRFADGALVEAVAIPHPERSTICLSTQAGCARGCLFCETGRLGLQRQLLPEEIVGQFAVVSRHLAALGRPAPSNIVFMGMGEPLDNLDAVLAAADVLSDDCGFAVAPRRITVSTVGVVPRMREFYRRSRYRLAVSLHAASDEERKALLPVARTWDLAVLREAIAESPEPVLLQWTMIDGVNDTDRHADQLLAFCKGLDVRVNLIPLNPGPEERLRAPSMERVRTFQKRLRDAGLRTLVRMPHGREIGGACGQLAGALREHPERKPALPVIGKATSLHR